MKIIRFADEDGTLRHGRPLDETTAEILEGELLSGLRPTNRTARIGKLLAPLVPAQILGVGLNYRHHANEAGMAIPAQPVLFVKGPNTLQDPGKPIVLPRHMRSDEVDYECELAVVIGRSAKNVTRERALDYVLGYTCANDVSARDWQLKRGGGQWCRGKFFDTFAPLGPCLVTADEIRNPNALGIRTVLNGEKVQDWNTNDMIFDVPTLIEFLSGSTTLVPGTVILTGTPHGVGMGVKPQPRWLRAGDVVAVEIDGIGTLVNPVVEEDGMP